MSDLPRTVRMQSMLWEDAQAERDLRDLPALHSFAQVAAVRSEELVRASAEAAALAAEAVQQGRARLDECEQTDAALAVAAREQAARR